VTKTQEVLHTNQKHPFFTLEKGFVPVGQLKVGMHVLRADGRFGVITGWKIVPGTKVMYNLEVAQDHTFVVGQGQWVVHNDCSSTRLRGRITGLNGDVDYQAQHVIPCATAFGKTPHSLVSLAVNAVQDDWFNEAWNGIALPTQWGDSTSVGLPQHLGSHGHYNSAVYSLLNSLQAELLAKNGTIPPAMARDAIQNLAVTLWELLNSTGGGCSINDVFD